MTARAAFPLQSRRWETLAVMLLLAVFAVMVLVHPEHPGMNSGGGLLMDQYLAGAILEMLKKNSFWDLFVSGNLPSQRDSYHSTLMAYLYIPFLKIFGRNWMVAKNWPVFWALPTLAFSYLFVRNLFGARAALLGLGLLILHPTYILGIRVGGALLSHMQFFSMGALCFLSFWWTTRKTRWLNLAVFFVGLGLSTQLWFYWFAAALAVNALVFIPDLRERIRTGEIAPKALIGSLACLLIGASLIVYREIVHGFQSVRMIFERAEFLGPGSPAASLFRSGWRTLCAATDHLASRALLESTLSFHPREASIIFPFVDWLFPLAFGISCLFLFSRPARERAGRGALLLAVTWVVMLGLAMIGPRGGVHHHLFFLYPFPPLIVAIALVTAWDTLERRRGSRPFLAAVLVLLISSQTFTLGRYLIRFFSVRDTLFYSNTIYDAAAWVRKNKLLSEPFAVFDERLEVIRYLYFVLPETDLNIIRLSDVHPVEAPDAGLTLEGEKAIADVERLVFIRHTNDIHEEYMDKVRRVLNGRFDLDLRAQFPDATRPTLEIYFLHPLRAK